MTKEEITRRIKALREFLKKDPSSGFLVLNWINLFYFTGNFFKGALLITNDEVKAFIKRPANAFSSLPGYQTHELKSLKDLLKHLNHRRVYADLKALSCFEAQRLLDIFSDFEVKDGSSLIWEVRSIKTDYELSCLKRASRMLSLAIKEWLPHLQLGMPEISASALLEERLRVRGHPGFTRSTHGFELTFGYLISGKEGLNATPFYTGEGGRGVEGFPGGASFKEIKEREPILFDFSGFFKGYYVDQTRMASFGRVKRAIDFYRASLEVLKTLERDVKSGMLAEEVWEIAVYVVSKFGLRDYFMHHGEPMKFVGHGVGLQIDEPPALAEGQKTPLKAGMVLAIEPKFHVPELGVIGLEDTFYLTPQGLKRLTNFSRDWIVWEVRKSHG